MLQRAERILTRNAGMPGICPGAFLGLCCEAFNACMNHARGLGAGILRQAAHFLVCLGWAWFSRKSVSEQNEQAPGRRWTEAGEKQKLTGFYFKTFDVSEIEEKR